MRRDTTWMTAPPLVNPTPGAPFTVVVDTKGDASRYQSMILW
jgi:hypothetical protein